MSDNIWHCKIGETSYALPPGSDGPMREAITEAYRKVTGQKPNFIFSGWAGELTEPERAVVENREPAPEKQMSDDLVEEVAKAICATRFNTRNVHEWDELPEDFKALYLADARAVIPLIVARERERCAMTLEALKEAREYIDEGEMFRSYGAETIRKTLAKIDTAIRSNTE